MLLLLPIQGIPSTVKPPERWGKEIERFLPVSMHILSQSEVSLTENIAAAMRAMPGAIEVEKFVMVSGDRAHERGGNTSDLKSDSPGHSKSRQ